MKYGLLLFAIIICLSMCPVMYGLCEEANSIINRLEEYAELYIVTIDDISTLPALDSQGYMHIFISEQEAHSEATLNHFSVHKLPGKELSAYLQLVSRYGVFKFRWYYHDKSDSYEWPLDNELNANLSHWILRLKTLSVIAPEKQDKLNTETLYRVCFNDQMCKALFIVPCCYDGDDINAPVSDKTMHLFQGAANRIAEIRSEGGDIIFPDFPYAETANSAYMHFRLIINSRTNESWIPVYTNLYDFLYFWNNKARIALATFDDLKDSYLPANGLLIDPLSLSFQVTPQMIEEIGH